MIGQQTVVASAARTTSGNQAFTTSYLTKTGSQLSLQLDVTAQSGTTPTLDVKIQWSYDGGTTWADADGTADSFAQNTGVVRTVCKTFAAKAPHYRVVWTIGGTTPSFTFSVTEYVI